MTDDFGLIDDGQAHCAHHTCSYDMDHDYDDYCCHCECCCTCLGCEYGPRDGMLMYPDGPAPWLADVEAANGGAS